MNITCCKVIVPVDTSCPTMAVNISWHIRHTIARQATAITKFHSIVSVQTSNNCRLYKLSLILLFAILMRLAIRCELINCCSPLKLTDQIYNSHDQPIVELCSVFYIGYSVIIIYDIYYIPTYKLLTFEISDLYNY